MLNFSKPCPSHWTDASVPATLEVSDDSIRVADKGSITERKVTYWTSPAVGEQTIQPIYYNIHYYIHLQDNAAKHRYEA